MYCLDTNIVVAAFRGDKEISSKFLQLNPNETFITPITLCELYKGAFLSSRPEKNLQEIEVFLSSVNLLDFSKEACEFFGREFVRLEKLGKMTRQFDLIIASIAKTNDLILITRNKKDFENIRVKLQPW